MKRAGHKATARASGSSALSLRDLNRATLARQALLTRESLTTTKMVSRLDGLQAQWPAPPYTGLWTRLEAFERSHLRGLIEKRELVRATTMRGTLHVVTATDYVRFRPLFAPMLAKGFAAVARYRGRGIDPPAIAAEARPFLGDGARTMEEIRQHLARKHPKADVRIMGYAVRMFLPLVQVPEPSHPWGFPQEPSFALAETWLGQSLPGTGNARELVRRYLAAFGPATARDVQTWSGIGNLADVMESLRPELAVFVDERGRELFDLPKAPRPREEADAPVRFLPEYDNLLLSHHDRTRFVPEAFRKGVYLPGLRVAATFLIDGFVHGAWKVERKKRESTLVLTPFATVPKTVRAALLDEGERLAAFVDPDAIKRSVRWEKS